jgi:hypothetical protein
MHRRSKLCLGVVLIALSIVRTATADIVTVTFALEVNRRLTGTFPGIPDSTLVPFNSTATLTFDSTYLGTWASSGTGYTNFTSAFVGVNQFTSGLTALLPWGPPFPAGTTIEYDRALFSYDSFDDGSAQNGLFFDKRHHYQDAAAMLEYRHAFALQGYDGTVYPLAPDFQDFRTDDLMAYLLLLQQQQVPMRFGEYGLIYDYRVHQYVSAVEYQARATITSIVPVPPAVWLFGSALGVMGVMRSKVKP